NHRPMGRWSRERLCDQVSEVRMHVRELRERSHGPAHTRSANSSRRPDGAERRARRPLWCEILVQRSSRRRNIHVGTIARALPLRRVQPSEGQSRVRNSPNPGLLRERKTMKLRTISATISIIMLLTNAATAVAADGKNKDEVVASIEKHKPELIGLSDQIWCFAETALRETRSSKLLADYAEKQGFNVKRGVAGMPTA